MVESHDTRQISPVIENLAIQVAHNKAHVARWGLNIVVFLFALLLTIIVLTGQGIGINVTAPIAITGLSGVWLVGWIKGKRLFHDFYSQEILALQERPAKEAVSVEMSLSSREKQILSYVAQGQANKVIGTELGISEQTVKNHVTSILRRLNAKDRTEAVVIAIKTGLISIDH